MRSSKIKNNFNQAVNTYQAAAITQKTAARHLVQALHQIYPHFNPATILDLGCGTGFVTEELLPFYPHSNFILNDLAEGMLGYCQKKFEQYPFSYLQGDMDTITFPYVDLIVSNFSLQWSANLQDCLQKLYQATSILAINCLIAGSLKEWQDQFPHQQLMHYPTTEELSYFIRRLDPQAHIYTEKFALQSPNPQAFIHQLKQIGATTPLEKTSLPHLKQILKSSSPITTHYHVLFAIMEHHV